MTFGEKLRRARREKGLTQAELANQAGLGLRTIIAYEKGETYPQKRSTYQTLADILGVQADDLHNEETTVSAPPAPSGRTASGGTKNCSRTAPPGRVIPPTKHTAKRWRNRPMRTLRAITINQQDRSYHKSRSARLWSQTSRRYCKSARTATSSTPPAPVLTKAKEAYFPPLNPS